MAYVMGGRDSIYFEQFKKFCFAAYQVIRNNGDFFISLFKMMLSAGSFVARNNLKEIPELTRMQDIEDLQQYLWLELSKEEAEVKFSKEIQKSHDNKYKQIDDMFHETKHKKGN